MRCLLLLALLLFPALAQGADCPDGKVLGWDGATCCWPGQNVGPFGCTGPATSCPSGLVPTDEGCSLADSLAAQRASYHPALLDPRLATLQAPETYAVSLQTTKGEIVIDVTRAWAPQGADRFYNLVKIGFFDDVAFFRVINDFMAQVGIHGDPKVAGVWREARILDDPVTESNLPGYVSFATSGPNTRTTQVFLNMADNHRLDHMGFSPFGKLRDLTVLEALYDGYGEGAPSGRGPSQPRMQDEGSAYLRAGFPLLDWIQSATVVGEEPLEQPAPAADEGALVPLNGTNLWVRRIGSGAPIVVVHGGPLLDHGYLFPHLEALAASHELIFYDQRISGRSDAEVPAGTVRMTDFVADLEALRAHTGHGAIHVLGHSFGARIALEYALAHPARVTSLLLLDPMAPSAALWAEERAAMPPSQPHVDRISAIMATDAYQAGDPAKYQDLMRVMFERELHDPSHAERLRFRRPSDLDARSNRLTELMPDVQTYDLVPRLPEITVPTLLMYGADEPASTISGPSLDAALPRSQLVIVEKAGHFPMVEQPDVFLSTVRAFLAR
mgnify:FL=1